MNHVQNVRNLVYIRTFYVLSAVGIITRHLRVFVIWGFDFFIKLGVFRVAPVTDTVGVMASIVAHRVYMVCVCGVNSDCISFLSLSSHICF
jgi:hypothetical protein